MDLHTITSILGTPGLVSRIGNTPLVPIAGLEGLRAGVEVWGKAEWLNPGGSVKDRAAWSMIQAGEASGALAPGRTLIDATSGNTGIAYAWIGATRGFAVELCVPANAGAARRRLLAALGADVVLTDPMSGTDGAAHEARRRAARDPARYFHPDQYSNPANWQAHYRGTAEEIWAQTEGCVTHLVAGVGTAGTLVGTARRLRELNPALVAVAVQPDSPLHALEGLKHLATAEVPAIYDPGVHQSTIEVSSEEAVAMAKRQARRGLAIGASAGAAVVASERVARALARGVVVCILPDGAERYLGDPLWEEGRP
ncbi:MAG TPA: PLP-dependent cysteine synthase family protein [Candidatus Eisenbacteria bacterium]|jgi:cysteine synthase B